jgi:hypothetical protein
MAVGCFTGLLLFCFWGVLFQDKQFGYRDAAHYYYPLYERVQTEWEANRWPLWEPEENSGMPLLGNPTAAVLYPGKLIYAALPYAWGVRVYTIVHILIAFVAMVVFSRGCGVSIVGSGLAALGYTFATPILFQYCNIIYLVGAAWLPLGFHAVDLWVRRGNRWGLLELSVVLALQILGGDPQVGYLLGLAAFGYAAGLMWSRGRAARRMIAARTGAQRSSLLPWAVPLAIAGIIAWFVGTVYLAILLPTHRPSTPTPPPAPLPWMPYVPDAIAGLWGAAGIAFFFYWRKTGWRNRLGMTWLGLLLSALFATMLSAAQLLPVIEFTQQTSRAASGGPHDMYPFSVEPFRLIEFFWPNILGNHFENQSYWLDAIDIPGVNVVKIWAPSLYVGGLTILLALGAVSFRRGGPLEVWMSIIVLVSVIGGLGQYTSPIWLTRTVVAATGSPRLTEITEGLGPLDPVDPTPIRLDLYLRDGDGSIYWWMTNLFPGFRQFRYPAKLFTFTCLGLAMLAGLGWDRVIGGHRGRSTVVAVTSLIVTLIALGLFQWKRTDFIAVIQSSNAASMFGPSNPAAAANAIVRSLTQAATVAALGLVAIRLARTRRTLAGMILLLIMTADLGYGNARYVLTVPQAEFETKPEMVRLIDELEKKDPSPGPFRVHRMPIWNPAIWGTASSENRVLDFVAWERDTIQPKYGINYGVQYTHTMGVAELYDYEWYFNGFPRIVRDPNIAKLLNVDVGTSVIYFPRRGVDLWNTRYIVTPSYPKGWTDEHRGYAAYLPNSQLLYPEPETFRGADGEKRRNEWAEKQDFQIWKNEAAYPRAWVVHNARFVKEVKGLSRDNRVNTMYEIIYNADYLWNDAQLTLFDPHKTAWIDQSEQLALAPFVKGQSPRPGETVTVSYPDPQHVELSVNMESPGIVVLSDTYYPGWELMIDDVPAPVYRVNRLMRGAAVREGHHILKYSYNPQSFRIGRVITIVSLGMLVCLVLLSLSRSRGGRRADGTENLAY